MYDLREKSAIGESQNINDILRLLMKGIILAGDSGYGLHPLTTAIPKQLLPVYDRPMVFYPIQMLVDAGIREILIITTSAHQELFKKALGDGSAFGASFSYACQDEPKGIADAINIGGEFIDKTGVCLITGDTILVGEGISLYIQQAARAVKNSGSATIFSFNETDERQYGQIIKGTNGRNGIIVGSSNSFLYKSIVGVYVFPVDAPMLVEDMEVSERGLLEVTTLANLYLKRNRLQVISLDNKCVWLDTNSADSLLDSGKFLQSIGTRNK